MVTERVRREAWKFGGHDPMYEPRIRVDLFDRENKWRPGGCWPCETVTFHEIGEEVVLDRDSAGYTVLEGIKVELYESVRDNDVALFKVANLLCSSSCKKERRDYYERTEFQSRLNVCSLVELRELLRLMILPGFT